MIPKDVEERINEWLNGPLDQATKDEILLLMHKDEIELINSFYTTLSFGTGGMRGLMGVGPNRMNLYTVQMATQGLANYLLSQPSKRDHHSVFISYDSRNHSLDFAMEAARVLAGNGITVYITFELRPTPFVSFGVRQKECSAGIMITASHNPKEYNGYKVFWEGGGQVVSPHDKAIMEEVKKITSFDQVKIAREKSPLIEIIDPELDDEYLEAIHKLQIDPKEDKKVGDQLKITYSALHGTGIKLLPRALKSWNFTGINLVDAQSFPNGNFPTVKSPNPENPEALKMGLEQLLSTQSDIFIATDPDADRLSVAALHHEKAYPLNGNQTAAICLEYICRMLSEQKRLPQNGAAVTTIVSTDLLGEIAKKYNLAFFEVLTGFKYIGELIHKWEQDLSHKFLFGAEESYGYLIGTHSLDKDAIVMSCLIAEIALLMKVEGRTLIDFLSEIYKKYGFFYETQTTIDLPPGKKGMEMIETMMEKIRNSPPTEILGHKVTLFEDYQKSLHNLPPANVLLFRLENKSKVTIRPSGTEPKLKIYATCFDPKFSSYDTNVANAKQSLDRLIDAVEALL